MIEGGNIMKSYTKTLITSAVLGFISGYCIEMVRQWGFNEGVNEGKRLYEDELFDWAKENIDR